MKKYLIIQPHSDDVLFSCSHLLFSSDCDVEILTVENNKKRIEEDRKLYDFLNIPFYYLDTDFDDQSYYGYHKTYKEVTVENSLTYLREFFDSQTLNDIEVQLSDFIKQFLKRNRGAVVVVPWGVGHPFHLFIRYVVEKRISLLHYYREFPHSYKKRSKVQVERQKQDYELLRSVPVENIADVKWELAKKFYKSQSSLLWFEKGYIEKNLPEEIYILKEQKLPFE